MATKELSIRGPVSLAVATNATSPAGLVGAVIWSTTDSKPLYWDGAKWAAFGAGAPGGVTISTVTLNFGTTPVVAKSFTFSDASAFTNSKIIMVPAPDSDEYEMDNFVCAAYCATNGTITAYITAIPGPVTGTRTFNYTIG